MKTTRSQERSRRGARVPTAHRMLEGARGNVEGWTSRAARLPIYLFLLYEKAGHFRGLGPEY